MPDLESLDTDTLIGLLTSCTQGRCHQRAVVVMEKGPHSVWNWPEKFCRLHMQMHTGGRNHECIWSNGKNIRAFGSLRSRIDRWLTPEDHEIARKAGEILRNRK